MGERIGDKVAYVCPAEPCQAVRVRERAVIKAIERGFQKLELAKNEIKVWEPSLNRIMAYEAGRRACLLADLERQRSMNTEVREKAAKAYRAGQVDERAYTEQIAAFEAKARWMQKASAAVNGKRYRMGERVFHLVERASDLAAGFSLAPAKMQRRMLKLAVKGISVDEASVYVELSPSLAILAGRKRPSPEAMKPELERLREALLEKLWPSVYKMRGAAFFRGTILGTSSSIINFGVRLPTAARLSPLLRNRLSGSFSSHVSLSSPQPPAMAGDCGPEDLCDGQRLGGYHLPASAFARRHPRPVRGEIWRLGAGHLQV